MTSIGAAVSVSVRLMLLPVTSMRISCAVAVLPVITSNPAIAKRGRDLCSSTYQFLLPCNQPPYYKRRSYS